MKHSCTLSISIVIVLLLLSACHPKQEELFKRHLLHHDFIKYEVDDLPDSTKVTMEVLIRDTINVTKYRLETLMMLLYKEEMEKTTFKFHNPPNAIYMYAYLDKFKVPTLGYVATLTKATDDSIPEFKFFEKALLYPDDKKDDSWGLTKNIRREIWNKLKHVENRARYLANKQFPLDEPGTSKEAIQKNDDLYNQLKKDFSKKIAIDYKIAVEILDSIAVEGLKYGWPLPE